MEYRLFGRTGVRISVVGLGCAGFGGIGSEPGLVGRGESGPEAFALMDRALAAGINYFDTADAYGGGRSEEIVGRWMADRRCRDDIFLATKVSTPVGDGVNRGGLSRRHILRQVDASLRRLRTEWIDLYMAHQVDPDTALDETLCTFDDLVRAGKMRYTGACNIESWRLMKSCWIAERTNVARFESVQNEYNLLRRHSQEDVLGVAVDQRIAVTPHSPLAGGWLTGKYRAGDVPAGSRLSMRPMPYGHLHGEQARSVLEAFEGHARTLGMSPATLALAWVASDPAVTSVLIGPRNPDQLDENTAAITIRLDAPARAAVVTALDAAAHPRLV